MREHTGDATPRKAKGILTDWHSPRLPSLIAGFIQIALAIMPFVSIYAMAYASPVEDPLGRGGIIYLIVFVLAFGYAILAAISAFLLIKPRPSFVFPFLFNLLIIAYSGLGIFGTIGGLVDVCLTRDLACGYWTTLASEVVIRIMLLGALLTLVLKGWYNQYREEERRSSAAI